MNNFQSILQLAFVAVFVPIVCAGQEKANEKYSLFNPVPRALMREMETDRPDVTESPYTLDAGHLQYETDFVRLVKEKSDILESNTLLINQANLKLGITSSTALQIGFQTYGWEKVKEIATSSTVKTNGIGDVTLRIKQNIIGNNSGNFALAILPYIKFPTSKYDDESQFEGGLIVPMSYRLPGDWKLGLQVEVDRLKDLDQPSMHTEFLQTLTISHPISKGIDGIAETYYTYDFKAHNLSNYVNAAIQIEVAKDFKLDTGINYGLQHSTAKHYFVGASYRH